MIAALKYPSDNGNLFDDTLFLRIATDIEQKGYSINQVTNVKVLSDLG